MCVCVGWYVSTIKRKTWWEWLHQADRYSSSPRRCVEATDLGFKTSSVRSTGSLACVFRDCGRTNDVGRAFVNNYLRLAHSMMSSRATFESAWIYVSTECSFLAAWRRNIKHSSTLSPTWPTRAGHQVICCRPFALWRRWPYLYAVKHSSSVNDVKQQPCSLSWMLNSCWTC